MKASERIPALSIRAPWAWAITQAGKEVENRTWDTTYRGRLYIHASRGGTSAECDEIQRISGKRPPENMARGAIIASVTLADIVPLEKIKRNPWAKGPWCWILIGLELLCERYMPGKLGLWFPS